MADSYKLRVAGLVKRFGGLTATDQASFEVRTGEMHALIGPNGAGKTTLIHQISGALRPDGGRISMDGADITRLPMHRRVRLGLARSYQITSVFKAFSVLDNVAMAVQARTGGAAGCWRPVRREADVYAQARHALERVGLAARADALTHSLSHGEQRKLEVALALATSPSLLLLDEPMAGMGPEESEAMVELLLGLRGEVTMLLVEHDMHAVFRLADRLSVLVYGRVIATGSPEAIRGNADVCRAYLGDEATVRAA
ncbi:ABC transporter ATP-binding protein [Pigmentiphaga sp. H8]|uniref:ABC transporter ATP-binding protein n=1 Tax=Pigmentiphaga sp. H8 TaxID=2488560 RepID=UPI000F59FD98|nr:ABC transporter ATP-binding protein [Pigmentiphaga sp. H8]AZG11295.1 ABC transporter ATP-binding protein [Pigmentiphaga sp. H8]